MEIIYIAGNGHSGSTILAMLLGQSKSHFCAGELTFITRSGILDEPCSCGSKIGRCETWQRIMSRWASKRQISLEHYHQLRYRYERNRTLGVLLLNAVWPSKDFVEYCRATQTLFDAIGEVTGATTVIDSSKGASRILVLKRFTKPKVIHLCRNFTGVLNSNSRFTPKDIEKGFEKDLHPTPPARTLFNWLSNNLLATVLSLGVPRCRVHYRHMVNGELSVLRDAGYEISTSLGDDFASEHMFAGNGLRLRTIKLDSTLGFRYGELSDRQIRFASIVDKLFWFWAR